MNDYNNYFAKSIRTILYFISTMLTIGVIVMAVGVWKIYNTSFEIGKNPIGNIDVQPANQKPINNKPSE